MRLQEVTEVSQLEAMTDESGRLAPEGWTGKHLALFAIDLGEYGVNLEYTRLLGWLRSHPKSLEGWTGGVTADADSDPDTPNLRPESWYLRPTAPAAPLWAVH